MSGHDPPESPVTINRNDWSRSTGIPTNFKSPLKPLPRQLNIAGTKGLNQALFEFALFYNHARPHQNLEGLTPAEKWSGMSPVDVSQTPIKYAELVSALDGLLVGFHIRR